MVYRKKSIESCSSSLHAFVTFVVKVLSFADKYENMFYISLTYSYFYNFRCESTYAHCKKTK